MNKYTFNDFFNSNELKVNDYVIELDKNEYIEVKWRIFKLLIILVATFFVFITISLYTVKNQSQITKMIIKSQKIIDLFNQ
jgi:hypothetical protein